MLSSFLWDCTILLSLSLVNGNLLILVSVTFDPITLALIACLILAKLSHVHLKYFLPFPPEALSFWQGTAIQVHAEPDGADHSM